MTPTGTSILLAFLTMTTFLGEASPLQPQPRAAATVYVYMTATTVATPQPTPLAVVDCSENSYVADEDDCPSGCVAAPVAGMFGIVTSEFSCETSTPVPSWTSYPATSTCEAGSAVTTYTLWGGQTQLGCKATDG